MADRQEETASPGLDRRLRLIAGAVIAGAVLTVLDATAVNVALDTLVDQLSTRVATAQWVLTGYLLMLALVVPISGWATDRIGTKRLWLAALSTFVLGSALCGAAWSIASLIAFRLLQGIGGGMIAPLAQTILARAAGPARVGRAMSMLGTVTVLGPVVGPVVGGALVQHAGWRWIFFINVPIGLVALAAAARLLPHLPERVSTRLDTAGLVLASTGLVAVTYGLASAGSHGDFTIPVAYGPIATGLVLLGLFAAHSHRRGPTALIDVRLFAVRGFTASAVALLLIGMALFGTLLLLPLYYQSVRGQGALGAGLLLAPQGLGVAVMLPLAGRLTDRLGARVVVIPGVVLMLVGTLAFANVGANTSYLWLTAALVVRGIGMGLVMTPVTAAALVRIPAAALARASAATVVIRQVGGSVGAALLAVILAAAAGAPVDRFDTAFWAAFALTALVLVPALFLPRAGSTNSSGPDQ